MKTLHLVLKSKWYDKIASGNKTSEYREIKPYWNKIFYPPCRKKNGIIDTTMCEIISTGIFDNVVFHRDEYEQCTGLKDKNGNLIYEGDLIKSPNNSHPLAVYHDITGLWRCKENRPNGIWELPLYDMVRNYAVEIIGNVHEQPEQKDK